MSRCKSCDIVLNTIEILYKNKHTGEHEELCTYCRQASFDTTPLHDYVCGLETETLYAAILREGVLTIEELPNFDDEEN